MKIENLTHPDKMFSIYLHSKSRGHLYWYQCVPLEHLFILPLFSIKIKNVPQTLYLIFMYKSVPHVPSRSIEAK